MYLTKGQHNFWAEEPDLLQTLYDTNFRVSGHH